MGKAESFAKHKMRENRHNQFRPEQQQMCREISNDKGKYAKYPAKKNA